MMAISSTVGLTGDSIGMFMFVSGKRDGLVIFGTDGRSPFFPLSLSILIPILISNVTRSSIDLSMSPLTIKMDHGHEDSPQNTVLHCVALELEVGLIFEWCAV